MQTKPTTYSPHAKWVIHAANGDHDFIQTGASLFDPEKDVVPFINCVDTIFGDRSVMAMGDALATVVKEVPGAGGTELRPDTIRLQNHVPSHTPLVDFAQFCHAVWPELHYVADYNNRVRGHRSRNTHTVPGYVWCVWRESGAPVELSFVMYDHSGKLEPMFDIPRSPVERFLELLTAPYEFVNLMRM